MEKAHNYIKMHRKKAGLSQDLLGKLLGINASTIHRQETGESATEIETLLGLELVLGVRHDELFQELKAKVEHDVLSRAEALLEETTDPKTVRQLQALIHSYGKI